MFNNPAQILQAFFSNDNAARSTAEKQLQEFARTNPNDSIDLHISALDLEAQQLAELAAVSIKNFHLKRSEYFAEINPEKLKLLSHKILSMLKEGVYPLNLCKRLVEVLGLLHSNDNILFNDLVQQVLALQDIDNNTTRISIMYFVELLCVECFDEDYLQGIADDLSIIFDKFLSLNDKNVLIATVKAICSLLSNLEDKEYVKRFTKALPALLQILVETIKQDEESAIQLLQSIGEIAETHPSLLKAVLEDILLVLSEVLVAKNLSNGLRNQALFCTQIFARSCDVYIRKSENFRTKILPAYMKVLCEVEQFSLEDWFNDTEWEGLSKEDVCFVAKASLNKLTSSLTSKFLLPHFMPLITQGLQSSNWAAVYSSIEAIGALTKDSSESFMNDLDQLMALVLPGLGHADIRIVYATFTTIEILASEYAPNLQLKFHADIIECILKVINSDIHLKLQIQAVKTLLKFCEGIIQTEEHKLMIPYGDRLLTSLVTLIQKALSINSDVLLQEVLNAISMLSSALDVYFVKYYTEIMSVLKKLLENIPNVDEKRAQIRIGTIECIGFIILSARNEQDFIKEVDQIMEYLFNMQQKLHKNDVEHAAIIKVYCCIANNLQYSFAKYMPSIFEKILLLLETDVELAPVDKDNDIPNKSISERLGHNVVEPDIFKVDISSITIKVSAMDAIFQISRDLGKAFYPYIEATLMCIKKYFDHTSRSLSRRALKTVKNLVMACENEKDVVELLHLAIPEMLKVLKITLIQIQEASQSAFILNQIYKSIRILTGSLLSEELVLSIIDLLKEALSLCQKEKLTVVKKYKELDEYDEEKNDEFQGDYEHINDLMEFVTDTSGVLLKLYGDKVQEAMGHGVTRVYYDILTGFDLSESEVLYTVRFFNVFLQYCSFDIFNKLSPEVLRSLVKLCRKSPSCSLEALQGITKGIGVISQRMDQISFKQIKEDILSLISDIISAPDAFSHEKMELADATTTVLGKIALFQYDLDDKMSEEILLKFLKLLPLKSNVEEAQESHRMLLEQIKNQNKLLISASPNLQQFLLKTVQTINNVDASEPDNEILDDFAREMINQILSNNP